MKDIIKANTITMTCQITGNVSIERAFLCLPVNILREKESGMPIVMFCDEEKENEDEETKVVRLRIPYFGHENIIVSCRTGNQSRGLRQGGKQLQHVVGIDLQLHGKNYHLKLSANNIHLTGGKFEELGEETFLYLSDYLNLIQEEYLSKIKKLSNDDIEIILDHFYNGAILPAYIEPLREYFDLIRDRRSYRREDIPILDRYLSREQFEEILEQIFANPSIMDEPIKISSVAVRNSFFTHKLSCNDIPVIPLQRYLESRFDKIRFANILGNDIKILIPCDKTLGNHQFVIFNTGTVRQHSPSCYKEAFEKYCIVFKHIEEFLEDIDD
jgi:hypothetical protein